MDYLIEFLENLGPKTKIDINNYTLAIHHPFGIFNFWIYQGPQNLNIYNGAEILPVVPELKPKIWETIKNLAIKSTT